MTTVVKERRRLRMLSALAMFLTALVLQRACTLTWGSTAASSSAVHTRYELTVVGLTRRSGADPAAQADCRWWPNYGEQALCAPRTNGALAFASLRAAYPLLQVAMWLGIVSLLLQTLRVPRQRLVQAALPALASAMTILAMLYVMRGAREGLAALDGLGMVFDGAGFRFALIGAILALFSTGGVLLSFSAQANTAKADTAQAVPPDAS